MRTSVILLFLILLFLPPLAQALPPHPFGLDGPSHIARLASFSQSIREGNVIPRWAGYSINFSYGHPVFIFIYSLPYYLGSLLHFMGFTLEWSVRLLFILGYIGGGVLMYLWLRTLVGPFSALIGTVFYQFDPYRFVDLYDRAALAEHLSFVMIPLIGLTTTQLLKHHSRGWWLGSVLSIAGLILTHYATTLVVTPFFLLFWWWQWRSTPTRKAFFLLGAALILGIGAASYYLLPAAFEGKYTHRQLFLERGKQYSQNFVDLPTLFSFKGHTGIEEGRETRTSIRLGVGHVLMLLAGLVVLVRFRQRWTVIFVVLAVGSILFMTNKTKPLYDAFLPLQGLQFPWRWMILFVTTSAVFAAFMAARKPMRWLMVLLAILVVFSAPQFWGSLDYWPKHGEPFGHNDAYYTGHTSTTESGEHSPRWAVWYMWPEPKVPVDVISGAATVNQYVRKQQERTYMVVASERSRILENTVYFPGWTVRVDGQVASLEFQDRDHRGLMTYWVEEGTHAVSVRFEETKARLLADFLSLGSLIVALVLFFGWTPIHRQLVEWNIYDPRSHLRR